MRTGIPSIGLWNGRIEVPPLRPLAISANDGREVLHVLALISRTERRLHRGRTFCAFSTKMKDCRAVHKPSWAAISCDGRIQWQRLPADYDVIHIPGCAFPVPSSEAESRDRLKPCSYPNPKFYSCARSESSKSVCRALKCDYWSRT